LDRSRASSTAPLIATSFRTSVLPEHLVHAAAQDVSVHVGTGDIGKPSACLPAALSMRSAVLLERRYHSISYSPTGGWPR